MSEISNIDRNPNGPVSVAVLLPEGFLKRYEMLCVNTASDSKLLKAVNTALWLENYVEASKLLKLEGKFVIEYEGEVLDQISNIAWRRLQMLPEKIQERVMLALRRGDVDFVSRVLKSF